MQRKVTFSQKSELHKFHDGRQWGGWQYIRGHIYQTVMIQFMSFLHGAVEYEEDAVFTREQQLEIRPIDVKRFLCMKAYGDPDPNNDARPTEGRSDSLYYIKKALSKFMPHRTANWVNGQGNPTKSDLVSDMIKDVKNLKYEDREHHPMLSGHSSSQNFA
jgi:hypothetical protein